MAARAAPGAELEAAVREVVEGGHALGDLRRVVHLGERVEDARADVDALGGVREVAEITSLAERCEYSSRKWCSVTHTYLKPALVGRLDQLELVA